MSEQYVDMELWKTIKKVLIEHESHCLDDKIDRFRIAQALYDGIASTPVAETNEKTIKSR